MDCPVATTALTMESTGSSVIPPKTADTIIAPTIAFESERVMMVQRAPDALWKFPYLIWSQVIRAVSMLTIAKGYRYPGKSLITSKKKLDANPTIKPGHNPKTAVAATVKTESRKKGSDSLVLIVLKIPFNRTADTIPADIRSSLF